ncbi:MAG: hypothetical protein ACREPZ_01545 [Rhodanobacteraceae bacterium]
MADVEIEHLEKAQPRSHAPLATLRIAHEPRSTNSIVDRLRQFCVAWPIRVVSVRYAATVGEFLKMKTSSGLILAAAIGTLMLQGCAATGETRASVAPTAATTGHAAPMAVAPTAKVPEENGKPVVKADTADNFAAIVAAIHQQMQPGGRWQYIDNRERATINGSFGDMQALYDQFGSVDKMDQAAKMRLLADQDTINAILTRKDGDRLICESSMPVGSHFLVKTCKTYAQRQAEQRGAQEFMRQREGTMQQRTGH